jgi:hypothetical protein
VFANRGKGFNERAAGVTGALTSPRPDAPALQRVISRAHEELFWQ